MVICLDLKTIKLTDFLAGSTEAKAATILHLLHNLSEYPDVQEKVFKEVSALSDFLTIESIKTAHYTRAVVYESFRMSPTAFAIARILEKDFEFSGYQLSAGVSLNN